MKSVRGYYGGVWVVVFCLLQACMPRFVQNHLYRDYAVTPLKYDLKQPYGQLVRELREKPDPIIPEHCFGADAVPASGVALTPDAERLIDCQQRRNMVIGDLVALSDDLCEQHIKTIFGNEAAVNITTGTLTNLFSGAATVIGGSVAKSALSAAAFFSNSERSLLNETVYKSVLVSAVVRKIETMRRTDRGKIRETLKKRHSDYPIHIALLDVVEYHRSCSFMFGLQRALEEGTLTVPTPIPTLTPTPTQEP